MSTELVCVNKKFIKLEKKNREVIYINIDSIIGIEVKQYIGPAVPKDRLIASIDCYDNKKFSFSGDAVNMAYLDQALLSLK